MRWISRRKRAARKCSARILRNRGTRHASYLATRMLQTTEQRLLRMLCLAVRAAHGARVLSVLSVLSVDRAVRAVRAIRANLC